MPTKPQPQPQPQTPTTSKEFVLAVTAEIGAAEQELSELEEKLRSAPPDELAPILSDVLARRAALKERLEGLNLAEEGALRRLQEDASAQARADRAQHAEEANRLAFERHELAVQFDAKLAELEGLFLAFVTTGERMNRERKAAALPPINAERIAGRMSSAGAALTLAPKLAEALRVLRPPHDQRVPLAESSRSVLPHTGAENAA